MSTLPGAAVLRPLMRDAWRELRYWRRQLQRPPHPALPHLHVQHFRQLHEATSWVVLRAYCRVRQEQRRQPPLPRQEIPPARP